MRGLTAQSTRNETDRIRAAMTEHDVDILTLTKSCLTLTAKDIHVLLNLLRYLVCV